ncbi:MAG: histidine phosphatase family protein [Deltaproteobacteria bacterium]|nr:histidine phosphatase family protein [Deltaproteobacteria bacterium]
MDRLGRLILVRHGETVGQSSIRYYGATDIPLSGVGRVQAREARRRIPGETFEAVWASSLARSWQAAQIIAPGHLVRLEADFREIDFGRWEGLTREEIERLDPVLYADWQTRNSGFEFPEGETRSVFRRRIGAGLARLRASGVRSALVVAHKGVVRTLLELVSRHTLAPETPELGGVIHVYRDPDGVWLTGRRGSDDSCGERAVGIPIP